ncbi:MAG: DNA primase [Vicinamibacterales bacterium]
MALFPQSFIDDLRLQANILSIVQEYVPLKRAGRNYKGLCPFHSEKSPSFTVDPEKGFFHCFGCKVGGDVFKFLELHEKLAFHEAVRMLAEKTGTSLPEMAESEDGRRDAALREGLLKAHEVAAEFFREQLASPGGARARQQLKDRGIAPATVDELGIGFAPASREGLKERLKTHGFSEALLLQSGLIVRRESGEVVDRFRQRLMIPICRDSGSVIAFGGRQMDSDQGGPKYLNSPETPIYSKGRTLYGLHLTKQAIRKLGYAVLVEGYFDFAQVYQSKVFKQSEAPVIASCGTALTPEQALLLRRFTTNVKLSFDPDTAGQMAATRSCQLLVGKGFEVKVVLLAEGQDPDNFIRTRGADAYREHLRTAQGYLDYVVRREATGVHFAVAEERSHYFEKMQQFANNLPDEAQKELFASKVAAATGITDATVIAQFRNSFRGKGPAASKILPDFGNLKGAEKGLIWSLFHNTSEALEALAELDDEDRRLLAGREIFELAQTLKSSPEHLPAALLQRLTEGDAQTVRGIAASSTAESSPVECSRALKQMRWERELATIQREIDRLQRDGADGHGDQIVTLSFKKKDLKHRIEGL